MLSNSIQQLLLFIRNGRQEVHARTLTSVCKSGINMREFLSSFTNGTGKDVLVHATVWRLHKLSLIVQIVTLLLTSLHVINAKIGIYEFNVKNHSMTS